MMSNWDANAWMAFVALIFSLLSAAGVLAFYVIRNTSKDEAGEAIEPLEDKIDNHEQRITKLEAREDLVPSQDKVAALGREVSDLAGEVRGINRHFDNFAGEMKGFRASIDRINSYLLERKD